MKFQISATLIAGPSGEYTLGLEEFLGHGSFGFVFKAVDMTNGTHYAVKFTQSGFNSEDEIMAFRNEVQAAQEIQHINVVRIVHVEPNPSEQPPYLVMEFINGGTLQSRLDDLSQSDSMLEIPLLQQWTNALIDGIAAINAKMLHRDLKPDNILMDGNIPKIGDFGLSKMIGAMTRSRTFKGGQHLWYMAPEGWKYETNGIQIDMYAMGIVFYQMASLQYPYELPQNLSERTFREMHLYQQPRPLQALRSDIPLRYCHIISRLLEKNPQERFSNWSEVQQAMEKVWASPEDGKVSPRETILALLQRSEQRNQEYTQQQTEDEKRKEEQEERLRLDVVQQHKLSNIIKGLIAEYNEICAPKMKIRGGNISDSMRLQLPFGRTVSLDFFQIDPPLLLEIGQVRLAAALKDQDLSRLNYILCRRDANDLYGTWKVCQVEIGLIVGDSSETSRRHELIGLSDATVIRIIEEADAKYIHISDKVEDAFLQVITEAMSHSEKGLQEESELLTQKRELQTQAINQQQALEGRQNQNFPIVVPVGELSHHTKDGYVDWSAMYETTPKPLINLAQRAGADIENVRRTEPNTQKLKLQNMGNEVAFNIHSFLYGPMEGPGQQYNSWNNGPIQGKSDIEVLYSHGATALFADTAVDGKHALYDNSEPHYRIARLTTTYHNPSGIKYVCIFDYIRQSSREHKWLHVKTTSGIEYDLEELDDQRQPPQMRRKPIK